MSVPKLVRIEFDEGLSPGKYRIGGVRVVGCKNDAALGRALRTVLVACHGEADAERLRAIVAEDDCLEMAE